jgi:hypothetical protein
MKPIFYSFFLSALVLLPAEAAPVLYLNPSSQISAAPGQTIGWGFTLTNTTDYAVVDSFAFAPADPALGTFTDFSRYNFVDVGPEPAESSSVTQLFSLASRTGVGSFQISPTAPSGTATGEISMVYDLYANDPVSGGALLSAGNTLSVPASIAVAAAAVPEPATRALLSVAALTLLICCRRISKA